jgi:hypothetical protein
MSDQKSRLPRPAGEPHGVSGRPECRGRVVQPPKPPTDLPERVVGAQPIRPWRSLAQGLAGQERQAFATLLIEAAGSRGAVEADVFQMPQHRVHGRRPRLGGAADFVADAYGSETAPAGQPSFGHPSVLPGSEVHGDRIAGSVRVEAVEPGSVGLEPGARLRRTATRRVPASGLRGFLHARGELSLVETYAAEIACTGRFGFGHVLAQAYALLSRLAAACARISLVWSDGGKPLGWACDTPAHRRADRQTNR